jgi:hypothetical protein
MSRARRHVARAPARESTLHYPRSRPCMDALVRAQQELPQRDSMRATPALGPDVSLAREVAKW